MASTAENVLTVRFADPAVYERLKERASAEHRSMNRLAEEAIEAFVATDRSTTGPIAEDKLRAMIEKIMRDDADILKALGDA
jgi:plasmid stability protein